MSRLQNVANVKHSSMLKGKPMRLRDGSYKQLKEREWIFNRSEKDIVFLVHKSGAYGVVVKTEDIDWDEC